MPMAKRKSVAPPTAQARLFNDRNRSSMSWSQIPDLAKARVLERLADLLRASNEGPQNGESEDADD